MRNGRLVVEDSPAKLLEKFCCTLLEDIVLKLCLRDEKTVQEEEEKLPEKRRDSLHNQMLKIKRSMSIVPTNSVGPFSVENPNPAFKSPSKGDAQRIKRNYATRPLDRIQALILKNLLVMFRSFG